MNWLFITILLIAFDIFIGIPYIWFVSVTGADFMVTTVTMIILSVFPMITTFLEMRNRSKYPIRAEVTTMVGANTGTKRVKVFDDRLGFIRVATKTGENEGNEWRLMNTGKPVQNFEPQKYIYYKSIWFGFKVAECAKISAPRGIAGEEFYPMEIDPSTVKFTTAAIDDWGMTALKILKDIHKRTEVADFWKQNIIQLAQGGLTLMVCIMLFLCFFKLGDVATALSAAASTGNSCSERIDNILSNSTTSTGAKVGNIAGIPFGVG